MFVLWRFSNKYAFVLCNFSISYLHCSYTAIEKDPDELDEDESGDDGDDGDDDEE